MHQKTSLGTPNLILQEKIRPQIIPNIFILYNSPEQLSFRIRLVDEGAMDLKTKIGDQVQVISDVGRRYKAAEVNAQSLEAEIKSLETTASKTKRLMDVAEKAQLAAKAAKDRARILAEHVTIAVSAEAGKMESSGGSESHDAADSVQTALMTMNKMMQQIAPFSDLF